MGELDLLLFCVILKNLIFAFLLFLGRLELFHILNPSQEAILFLKVRREEPFGEEILNNDHLLILLPRKLITIRIPLTSNNPIQRLHKIPQIQNHPSLPRIFPLIILVINGRDVIPTPRAYQVHQFDRVSIVEIE